MATENAGAAFVTPFAFARRQRADLDRALGAHAAAIVPALEELVAFHRTVNAIDAEYGNRQTAAELLASIEKAAGTLAALLKTALDTGAALKLERQFAALTSPQAQRLGRLRAQVQFLEAAARAGKADCPDHAPQRTGRPGDPSKLLRQDIRTILKVHGLPTTGKTAQQLLDVVLPAAGFPAPGPTASRSL